MQGTDNSLLDAKVKLRMGHMPSDPVRVLDCYGGFGVVWKEVKKRSGRQDIERVAIDVEDRPGALRGNNVKWLKSLDLSRYNVIDLDAYGVPFDQMKVLFDRGYSGTVFFTFIQSVMGAIPNKLIYFAGITREMVSACPTLWGQIGWMLWTDWLAKNGVRTIWHHTLNRKHYGGFSLLPA